MVLCLTLPNLTSIYFAYAQPDSLWIINAGIAFEQFGYGFGFPRFHVAIRRANTRLPIMLFAQPLWLCMMLPGMAAGALQEWMGYQHFFIYVMVCALVPILMVILVRPKLKKMENTTVGTKP